MEETLKVGRPIALGSSTTGSFDQELRELLWARCTKALGIGLGITVLFALLYSFFFHKEPLIHSFISRQRLWWNLGHPASFALGLGLLGILRRHACLVKIQMITFMVFALNMALLTTFQLSCKPNDPGYLGLSLLFFIPAAFIPWRAGHQLGLLLVALASFLAVQFVGMTTISEIQMYWYAQTDGGGFVGFVVMSFIGISVLGGVSYVISRTLYTLNKTTHQVKRLGNYIIEDEIGAGGMGKVFLAKHAMIFRPAAVKVMAVPEGEAEASLIRFEREVHLSAHLTHPNTIQIYDFGRSGHNTFYYAMEYLKGMDLQQLVDRYGPLPPERVAFILEQVCGSLSEAHAREIVHRDIKPSNIFLTERGGLHDFAKTLDFGLAKQVRTDGATSVTKTGMVFGTPRYISPEALYGGEKLDGRSDLYNLGGVGYWLLTGQPPFDTRSSVDLIIDHVKTIPARPSEISETEIPAALDDIIMKCLAKDVSDRFQSAAELKAALAELQFAEPWNWEKAREWWELHGLAQDGLAQDPVPSHA